MSQQTDQNLPGGTASVPQEAPDEQAAAPVTADRKSVV